MQGNDWRIMEWVNHAELKVCLPKLLITPFNGTHINWARFWSQFETKNGKNQIIILEKVGGISKVSLINDGLPLNIEAHERENNTLKKKLGKPVKSATPMCRRFNSHQHYITSMQRWYMIFTRYKLTTYKC